MKSLLGSVVFLMSLFLVRQVMVGAGVLTSGTTLLFLVGLVGLPLGAIVLVEGAFEHEFRAMRERIERLESELASRDRSDSSR
ncbi:MAG: hypothetical protein R3B81_09990 [bacterium]|nr:hypothetical protein [Gemmatimonadota bacterium]